MSEADWERHAFCPNCGNRTTVTVQAEVQNKEAFGKVDYPCINCGTPLALLEGKAAEEPDVPVAVDTRGGVIALPALVAVATADVEEQTSGRGTLNEPGQALVRIAVRSVVEALEGLKVLPKGAVEK